MSESPEIRLWQPGDSWAQEAEPWADFRAFVEAGNRVPLLWEEGVTMLDVTAHPDGSFEVRRD